MCDLIPIELAWSKVVRFICDMPLERLQVLVREVIKSITAADRPLGTVKLEKESNGRCCEQVGDYPSC